MYIFHDITTGDEVLTDALPQTAEQEGAIIAVKTKKVPISGDFDIGANPSAEEEEIPQDVETELNVVLAHTLKKMEIGSKKLYKAYMKAYWKNLKTALDKKIEEATEMKLAAQVDVYKAQLKSFKKQFPVLKQFVKDVAKNFGDYDFFLGESNNFDGLIIPAKYEGSEVTPTLYYITVGLDKKKC